MKAPTVLSTHSVNWRQYQKGSATHPFEHDGRPVFIDDSLPREGLYEGLHPTWLKRCALDTVRQAMKLIGADLGTSADQTQIDAWNAKLEPIVKATGMLEFYRIMPTTVPGRGDAEYRFRFSLPHPRRIDIARQPSRETPTTVFEDGV